MAEDDTIEEGVLEQLVQKLTPCIEHGDLDACVEEAARLAEGMGIDAGALLALSSQMGNSEKHDFAYVLALGAVDGLDGSVKAGAYSNAGLAAQSLGNMNKAEIHYIKSIEVDPNYAAVHFNYANMLNKLNRKDEAKIHYIKSIEIDPNYAAAHFNYAILLNELDKKDEAEKHYIKAIKINPKFAAAHYNYTLLLNELNRKDETETHYIKAIEANPKFAAAHNDYANLLVDLNRKDEAEALYIKAIEVDPNYATAHLNYAIILRERGKFYEAEKEVRIALQIAQDDSSSQHILPYAHGTLGDILADEDCYEEAEREYQKALVKSDSMDYSSISEIHNNLGWVYTQMRKYEKARDEFKKAHALDPINVKAIRNLRALGRIGDEPIVSKIQICLGIVLLIPLIISYYLFIIGMLSETLFVAQSTVLIALLIFVALHHQLAKVKIGNIEFEKSTEHRSLESKSQLQEAISMMER